MRFVEECSLRFTDRDCGLQVVSSSFLLVEDGEGLLRVLHLLPFVRCLFILGIAGGSVVIVLRCGCSDLFSPLLLSGLVELMVLGILVLEDTLPILAEVECHFRKALAGVAQIKVTLVKDALVAAHADSFFVEGN